MGNVLTTSCADAADVLSSMDDFDFNLLLAAVAAKTQHDEMKGAYDELLDALKREEHNRRRRKEARDTGGGYNKRPAFPTWAEIRDETTPAIFRKKYWMTKSQFSSLCSKINTAVGEKEFRPDATNKSESYLSGETRVAIGLRILCGGSYIDYVGRAYGVRSVQTVYNCFDKLVTWLEMTFEFPLINLLQQLKEGNEEALKKLRDMSEAFALDSVSCLLHSEGTPLLEHVPREDLLTTIVVVVQHVHFIRVWECILLQISVNLIHINMTTHLHKNSNKLVFTAAPILVKAIHLQLRPKRIVFRRQLLYVGELKKLFFGLCITLTLSLETLHEFLRRKTHLLHHLVLLRLQLCSRIFDVAGRKRAAPAAAATVGAYVEWQ